ncbi:MAG: hypothetical protein BWY93_01796 [Euryarchaeota archaeon ADurb.BinA087]|nr:MAG: hypothetical protein BWY93_01796 [Euryarchaeota archaeon ADurb.BinA087]
MRLPTESAGYSSPTGCCSITQRLAATVRSLGMKGKRPTRAIFFPTPSFISTSDAFISTASRSSGARRELIAATPIAASRLFSDRAYAASSCALFRDNRPASRTTVVWSWGLSLITVVARPQWLLQTAVQWAPTRTARTGTGLPGRVARRSSIIPVFFIEVPPFRNTPVHHKDNGNAWSRIRL